MTSVIVMVKSKSKPSETGLSHLSYMSDKTKSNPYETGLI